MAKLTTNIQAAVLSLALLAPAGSAFAATTHHHHRRHTTYSTTSVRHRHHYSRTRGTVVGAVAGAIIDHRHPVTGAVIGGALGNAVQAAREKH